MAKNKSKYPLILIDKDNQSAIPTAAYYMSVEEFYDLMHHTHNIDDIEGYSGEAPEVERQVRELTHAVAALQETVATLTETLNTYMDQDIKISDTPTE